MNKSVLYNLAQAYYRIGKHVAVMELSAHRPGNRTAELEVLMDSRELELQDWLVVFQEYVDLTNEVHAQEVTHA